MEGTCRHPAGLQHRCSACEKLELCITSDKYNLFYQTTWFLSINPCVFRRLVNLVPDKRFRRNQTYPQRRFVPRKRFRWDKTGPVTQNFDQPRNVRTAAVQDSPMVFPLTTISCSDVVVIRKYGRWFLGIRVLVEQIIKLSNQFTNDFARVIDFSYEISALWWLENI